MGIDIHEIAKMVEEIEIGEIVGMEDPITETTDATTEVGETVMIEIEAEDMVETTIVEIGGPAQPIVMDHGVREVLQEGEKVVGTIEIDTIDIEDDLVKAREEKKKGTIIRTTIERTITRNFNLHGNG